MLVHKLHVEGLELVHKVRHHLLSWQDGGAQVEGSRLCAMCERAWVHV